MPKYCFLLLLILTAARAQVQVETGEINGSQFRIDMPSNFNGTLLMYCHGYSGVGQFDTKPARKNISVFTDAGIAVAQAGYSAGGWAVKEGVEDTEALRRYFARKHGQPRRTYVTGYSMGGTITLATIETYPEAYDGALPMCGPLSNILEMLQGRVFDLLVVFDYYFPGALGSPVDPVVKDFKPVLDANPARRAALTRYARLDGEAELAPLVTFYARIMKELAARTGGNPFDNRNTIYFGGDDDAAINRGVKRFAASRGAAEYLRRHYSPAGRPLKPVLAVHTIHDPIVPVWTVNPYGELTRRQDAGEMFVLRYVARPGHCGISTDEAMHAFEDMVTWRETGKKPAPGEQK